MKLLTAIVFAMLLNISLFLVQISATELINEAGGEQVVFYHYGNSTLANFDSNGNYTLATNATDLLPDAEGEVTESSDGNIFTDTYKTITSWLKQSTGFNYVMMFFTAIPNFLKALGLPPQVSFALGALWHSIFVLLVIAFIIGRT